MFNLTSLRLHYVCALLFKYRNTITLHIRNTRCTYKININISKLSITFPQFGPYYVYVNCVKFKVNFVNDNVCL